MLIKLSLNSKLNHIFDEQIHSLNYYSNRFDNKHYLKMSRLYAREHNVFLHNHDRHCLGKYKSKYIELQNSMRELILLPSEIDFQQLYSQSTISTSSEKSSSDLIDEPFVIILHSVDASHL